MSCQTFGCFISGSFCFGQVVVLDSEDSFVLKNRNESKLVIFEGCIIHEWALIVNFTSFNFIVDHIFLNTCESKFYIYTSAILENVNPLKISTYTVPI